MYFFGIVEIVLLIPTVSRVICECIKLYTAFTHINTLYGIPTSTDTMHLCISNA